jgi:hypothetical protein
MPAALVYQSVLAFFFGDRLDIELSSGTHCSAFKGLLNNFDGGALWLKELF